MYILVTSCKKGTFKEFIREKGHIDRKLWRWETPPLLPPPAPKGLSLWQYYRDELHDTAIVNSKSFQS